MTAAFDASSVVSASTGDFSWLHTPSGTPRGVGVGITQYLDGTDQVNGVTYGGVPMSRWLAAFKTTGEPLAVYVYFLGSGVPTGAQTVAVDVNATGSTKRAAALSVTAGGDTYVNAGDDINTDSQASPVQIPFTTTLEAVIFAALFSGVDAVSAIAPGADYTQILEYDAGLSVANYVRRTTNPPAGSVTVEWTTTSTEDAVGIAIAIAEVVAQEVTLTPATVTLTAQALTITLDPVTVVLTPATASLGAQALGVTPGPVAVTLTPATATFTAQNLNPAPGPVAVTLTPAQASATAQPLGVSAGAAEATLTPAGITAAAQPLNPAAGPSAATLTPAAITLTAQPLTPGVPAPPVGPLDFTYYEQGFDVWYHEPDFVLTYLER